MGWNPCGYDLKISPSRLTRDLMKHEKDLLVDVTMDYDSK